MRRAERGVASKRNLGPRGEDPHLIVGAIIGGPRQECRFAQIGPSREGRHVLRAELIGLVDDSHRVSTHQLVGEDIDLCEPPHGKSLPLALRLSTAPAGLRSKVLAR
jgi:hypothetical protein